MSTQPAIRLENIGKCYRIYANPQDRFKQALKDRFGQWLLKQSHSPLYREHWALRDVTFEVAPGEAVGILGRNGAGKSTLLQIIAGTLAPTTGTIETTGRITALLELGSGFNPEFTGRENVFHNAQILGLNREETHERFDDIAAFADIGDFIDQPVKTYSSGMMMRLAFAVQTVLEPKILIVDEALAVGDARFQEKCFRKLRELRDRGVSILFVTHDVNSVTTFCDRSILMESGAVMLNGQPSSVVKKYLEVLYSDNVTSKTGVPIDSKKARSAINENPDGDDSEKVAFRKAPEGVSGRFGNGKVEVVSVEILTPHGEVANALMSGGRYRIQQRILVNEDIEYLSTGFIVRTTKSVEIFGVTNKSVGKNTFLNLKRGHMVDVFIDVDLWLAAGEYILQVANAGEDGIQYDCILSALHFTVLNTPALFTSSIVNLCPEFGVVCLNGDAVN